MLAVPAHRWLGRRVFLLCGLAPLATVVWGATRAGGVFDGAPVEETVSWVPQLGLDLPMRLDGFSLLMVALVSGIGTLIFVYARFYFDERPDLGRFAGTLVAFAGAMLGLVLSDNILAVFVFWELTSVTSYLLIGFEDTKGSARAAALQAFLTTGAGGLAMLGGFVLLGQEAGTYSLSAIVADPPSGAVVDVALVLVLLGAFTKSAQVPFHFWLPGAMTAPTPVSAYLHSATMVKAGVYLVARLAPPFADAGVWRPLVLTVGLATMLLGGWRALRQHDLKLVLAYGTISQLGFMTVLLGAGYEEATLAGASLLVAHGAFKATLFMVTGVVDHQAHTRDLRRLTGLWRQLRATFVVAAVAVASMAGLPPLLGFVAKEAAYEAFVHGHAGTGGRVVLAVLVAGSVLTFAYSARFLWGGFATKEPADRAPDAVGPDVPAPAAGFLAPAALLAALTAAFGLLPGLLDDLVVGGARALDELVGDEHLALWHGVNEALALSVVTIAGGSVLWARRRRVERLQQRVRGVPDAAAVYQRAVSGTLLVADRLTGVLQNGSLPIYLGVILMTVLALPGVALLTGATAPDGLLLFDRPLQLPVAGVIVVAALGVSVMHRRFAAVLLLGAVGYGVAVLFVIQGAPDLALTQLLVETLVVVVFVLVLRHLPERFGSTPWRIGQVPRVVVAVGVGVFVAAFSLVAFGARVDDPVSTAHVERALPEADGRNVVNVILVDFRGFDTLGEIVVLTVASLGITGLVRAARRDRQRARAAHPERAPSGVSLRRSLLLDGAVRVLFHTVLLFSVFFLFVGHNAPGGGFIGGLVAGAGFVLVYIAGGAARVRRAEPLAPEMLLGAGVTIAAVTGAAAWLTGGQFLESGKLELDLPLLGHIKATSVLAFDIGVYLVVIGLVVSLLRTLGREEVEQA